MKSKKILVIVGPTASGKSALAVELAKKFNGEVISADSRQVYRGLDIGTGKMSSREMRGVRHHLLDVASPKSRFTASDFVKYGHAAIEDIAGRDKLPIIAGGTGFYIDALVGRISLPDVPPNATLRARLHKKTATQLYALLTRKKPARARALSSPSERNNKLRLIRALEIASSRHAEVTPRHAGVTPRRNLLWIGVAPSDKGMRTRINFRLKERMTKGMIDEARRLHSAGLSYKRMHELGLEYRSLARYLRKEITRDELITELQSDIWRYARKQLGYWKRNNDIRWFDPKSRANIAKKVEKWLKR